MGCVFSDQHDFKVSTLQRTRFALGMTQEDIEQLQQILRIVHYEAEETVVVEGAAATHFFILIEGEVEISCLSSEGEQEFIMLRRAGDSVGDISLLESGAKYPTTAVATEPSSALVASAADFRAFFNRNRPELRREWESMLGENVFTWLRRVDILSDLQDWLLYVLANLFRYVVAKPGRVMIEQEVPDSRSMFIVVKGKLREFHRTPDGTIGNIVEHGPGTYFGEMAMIIDVPRMTTVEVVEPTLLLELPVTSFQDFLDLTPQVTDVFATVAKQRIARQLEKSNVPFFRTIPRERLADLADVADLVHCEPGETIIKEGEISSTFYVIMYGAVDVSARGDHKAVLSVGHYFGEVGLVSDMPRTATIKARVKTVLFAFERDEFAAFFSGHPEAYAEFTIRILRERSPIEPILALPAAREYLRRFTARELSSENVDFYAAVEAFRRHAAILQHYHEQRMWERYVHMQNEQAAALGPVVSPLVVMHSGPASAAAALQTSLSASAAPSPGPVPNIQGLNSTAVQQGASVRSSSMTARPNDDFNNAPGQRRSISGTGGGARPAHRRMPSDAQPNLAALAGLGVRRSDGGSLALPPLPQSTSVVVSEEAGESMDTIPAPSLTTTATGAAAASKVSIPRRPPSTSKLQRHLTSGTAAAASTPGTVALRLPGTRQPMPPAPSLPLPEVRDSESDASSSAAAGPHRVAAAPTAARQSSAPPPRPGSGTPAGGSPNPPPLPPRGNLALPPGGSPGGFTRIPGSPAMPTMALPDTPTGSATAADGSATGDGSAAGSATAGSAAALDAPGLLDAAPADGAACGDNGSVAGSATGSAAAGGIAPGAPMVVSSPAGSYQASPAASPTSAMGAAADFPAMGPRPMGPRPHAATVNLGVNPAAGARRGSGFLRISIGTPIGLNLTGLGTGGTGHTPPGSPNHANGAAQGLVFDYRAYSFARASQEADPFEGLTLAEAALQIWNHYVAPGKADEEVNLKAANIQSLRRALEPFIRGEKDPAEPRKEAGIVPGPAAKGVAAMGASFKAAAAAAEAGRLSAIAASEQAARDEDAEDGEQKDAGVVVTTVATTAGGNIPPPPPKPVIAVAGVVSTVDYSAADKLVSDMDVEELEIDDDGYPIFPQPPLFAGVDALAFDDAQSEIVFLMRDTLSRFKRSSLFAEMLDAIGSYDIATQTGSVAADKVVRRVQQQMPQGSAPHTPQSNLTPAEQASVAAVAAALASPATAGGQQPPRMARRTLG